MIRVSGHEAARRYVVRCDRCRAEAAYTTWRGARAAARRYAEIREVLLAGRAYRTLHVCPECQRKECEDNG